MSIKEILVHLDDSSTTENRLHIAYQLSKKLGARLRALYVIPPIDIPPMLPVDIDAHLMRAAQTASNKALEKASSYFEAITTDDAVTALWDQCEGHAAHHLITRARFNDLLVLGQNQPGQPAYPGIPDEVIVSAGVPTLIVPYIGAKRTPGQRVIVGWNASREATRAINDALPLLQGAEEVVVHIVQTGRWSDVPEGPGMDIGEHLAHHGVVARVSRITAEDIDVSNLMLSSAADYDADLIVMGAYGHSRFRELVLGGVTRNLLQQMTVPVLMAH